MQNSPNSSVFHDVPAIGVTEESLNDGGEPLKAAQGGQHQPLELIRAGDDLLADPVVLGVVPDLLDGIDFRRVGRQEMEFQTPLRALNEFPDRPAAMDRMAIHDEEDRAFLVMQQTPEKLDEALGVQRLLVEHEAELTPRADGTDDIERETGAGGADHGRLALRGPSGACMMIRPDGGFVQEIDDPVAPPRPAPDLRKDLRLPPGHLFGILLLGPEQGALGRQTQLMEQSRDAPAAEPDPKLLMDELADQLERPESKGKLPLRGRVPRQGAIEPFDGLGIELRSPPAALAGIQGVPATGTVQGQPMEQGRAGDAHATHHLHDGDTFLHLGDRLASELREFPMRQSAKIGFLGHAASLTEFGQLCTSW